MFNPAGRACHRLSRTVARSSSGLNLFAQWNNPRQAVCGEPTNRLRTVRIVLRVLGAAAATPDYAGQVTLSGPSRQMVGGSPAKVFGDRDRRAMHAEGTWRNLRRAVCYGSPTGPVISPCVLRSVSVAYREPRRKRYAGTWCPADGLGTPSAGCRRHLPR